MANQQSEQNWKDIYEFYSREPAEYTRSGNVQGVTKQLDLIEGQVFTSTTMYGITFVQSDNKMLFRECKDSPWQLGVCYNGRNEVCCFIKLDDEYIKSYNTIKGDITCKLFHQVDDTKTIEKTKEGELILSSGMFCGFVGLGIDIETLQNLTNGFFVTSFDFKIQTSIKITNIVKQ